ncbi:MAG: Na+/H+ antiporter NhaA [Deltaproteobacteria bacterium]|nr:MAG: Na+/H+ antiporter NhaA [Deltaproteobacteria bacterium]
MNPNTDEKDTSTPVTSPGVLKAVKYTQPVKKFIAKIVSGSFPLFFAAILAIAWANISRHTYHDVWYTHISISLGKFSISKPLAHWIDEALMALFFFTVGLEIKREVIVGELASFKKALLPVTAAAGGMLIPALIYVAINLNSDSLSGWGIPMATDIAFSLAVLSILGKRIPFGIYVFLSAFAIADDLGAVLVIALFYTKAIAWKYLLLSLLFLFLMAICNLLWIRVTLVYAVLGIGLWFAILGSGIHATVAGVLTAMFIPARGKYDTQTFINKVQRYIHEFNCQGEYECGYTILLNKNHQNAVHHIDMACEEVKTPLQKLEWNLNPWVAYLILPLFALANSGIVFRDLNFGESLSHPVTLGVLLGLIVGKPVGISLFTFLSVKLLKTELYTGITWQHILGASMLGGIGFTMSIFITGLSFENAAYTELSKLGIIFASLVSGGVGFFILRSASK